MLDVEKLHIHSIFFDTFNKLWLILITLANHILNLVACEIVCNIVHLVIARSLHCLRVHY